MVGAFKCTCLYPSSLGEAESMQPLWIFSRGFGSAASPTKKSREGTAAKHSRLRRTVVMHAGVVRPNDPMKHNETQNP